MASLNSNQQKVYLRTQVKLAQKKAKTAQDRETLISNKIRIALKAGDRPAAEKLALALNEAREDLAFANQQLKTCQNMEAKMGSQLDQVDRKVAQAKAMQPLIKAQDGLASSLNKLSGGADVGGADDMIRKLEEQAALSEAKMEIAMDDAAVHAPIASAELEKKAAELDAEDILRQMELEMGNE
ncbi:MAG: hypothetical protein P1V97_34080 [Planctomycetota bacterium]|nr:hypothetical protein [Planctomycetota bacterium]